MWFLAKTNKREEEGAGAACLQTVSPHRRLNMQTEVSNEVILKDTYSFALVPFFNDIWTHVGDVFPLLFLKVVAILRGGGSGLYTEETVTSSKIQRFLSVSCGLLCSVVLSVFD